MNPHSISFSDFIENQKGMTLENQRPQFDNIFNLIKRFKAIDSDTQMLEIGTGVGWLLLLCKHLGMECKGIEVSPELVRYAHQFGQRYGITPDIEVGSIDEADIGLNQYDIIVASSTFEHVQNWQHGLEKVFTALKPNGLFYFYSTNKFAFQQGEYNMPFYGWLPDRWRYSLRKAKQGDDVMQWGIDFNQFTHFQLRRFFKELGFSKVMDLIDILDPDNLNHPTMQKKLALGVLKNSKLLKELALLFVSGTLFICIK
jgi:2-polyprenyl-3-methyl-5-hydroxy-6-metoxy-1,4-benzoquinol methylase